MKHFVPTRDTALERLHAFLPRAGRVYANERNYDFGENAHDRVSCLSPWVRTRSLPEEEIVHQVLAQHSLAAAEKFIQEVCWRTYWKGWLAQRPVVWTQYLSELAEARERVSKHKGFERAVNAETDFNSFNTWTDELRRTGYLHNHARMWFASIWVHTLKLPWQLGAAFFMEHLLDGDCASNTLSWRWVAGRQTLGKAYKASPQNIQKYTQGRLGHGERFDQGDFLEEDLLAHPKPLDLQPLPVPEVSENTGLLITEDDLRSWECFPTAGAFKKIAGIFPIKAYQDNGVQDSVITFRKALLQESLNAVTGSEKTIIFDNKALAPSVVTWARRAELTSIFIAEPAVGFWSGIWPTVQSTLESAGLSVTLFRRPWDDAFYPHAKKGFFNLKKRIPEIVGTYA